VHARSKQTATQSARIGKPRARRREPILAQIAGFVDLFVWLLVLKSFFLPLFIIPTGSMAETLAGACATHICPRCGYEYPVGFHDNQPAPLIQCPNCRYREATGTRGVCPDCGKPAFGPFQRTDGLSGVGCRLCGYHELVDHIRPLEPLRRKSGDRIVVHGWPYALGGRLGPQRWDVVVFKVPRDGQTNYIKRLIGLPREKVEIIDGDVFVTDPDSGETQIARKTRHAQGALWFPYYDHDCHPREPSSAARYYPRWIALRENSGWSALDTRTPRFDGVDQPPAEIQFVTQPGDNPPPGEITDVYGYNAPAHPRLQNVVNDVRLSADVTIEAGNGYVELTTTKYADRFYARLYADGRVTLEHGQADSERRELWKEASVAGPPRNVRFALANADYLVSVEIDGESVIQSTLEQYAVEPGQARENAELPGAKRVPLVRVGAERVQASLAHVLIQRDVFYTSRSLHNPERPGLGTQGHPIQLSPDQYFVCGDNSPASLDSRWWVGQPLGAHLRKAKEQGEYQLGTVPADQMIGRAFLVYWPGFMPLFRGLPNCLPDLGRVRWIH
jgi:signal peptidase I